MTMKWRTGPIGLALTAVALMAPWSLASDGEDPFGRDLFGPPPAVTTPPDRVPDTVEPPKPVPPVPADPSLSPELVKAFEGVRADRPPKKLTNEKHYIVSNERRLDFWANSIDDRGGIYIGVGTDQNYVLAGWCKPKVMVLMDFDQLVVDMQYVYWAFLKVSETPAAFIARWTPDRPHRKEARAIVEAAYKDRPQLLRRALKAYRYSPKTVFKRLSKSRDSFTKHGVKTFLNDAEQYRIVRDLVEQNRVFAVRGDLLADKTLQDIANVARRFELKVRVLYLSNTEMYFNWVRGFKKNMLALPMDDRSLVLRTLPVKPADYRYLVQAGPNFQGWVRARSQKAVWNMYKKRRLLGEKGRSRLFVIDATPPAQ